MRGSNGGSNKEKSERPQEPAAFAEIGNLVEEPDGPIRQMGNAADGCRVDEDHREDKDAERNGRAEADLLPGQRPERRRRGVTGTRGARQNNERGSGIVDAAPQHRQRRAHGDCSERNIDSATGRPMLMLKPSIRALRP
jgi:hypothetical protein